MRIIKHNERIMFISEEKVDVNNIELLFKKLQKEDRDSDVDGIHMYDPRKHTSPKEHVLSVNIKAVASNWFMSMIHP